ncbi:hypothetical protein GP486_001574 [Trichoglossum hirsutum]|uniref:Uncharacterized protein n=1 Tax=Trichoglossum hirsutum TaxID=265104 RepID=A0A9P8RSI2_9PEZI|nr:hypothetical protein GP486_001574 [Trichoglossum hirsutum]
MHYSSIILAALATTGAMATPWGLRSSNKTDSSITVYLSNQATELGSQTTFTEGKKEEQAPVASTGPYRTVELRLGKDVQKRDYRCKLLDDQNMPIVLTRGNNTDITFGDGGKGEWTFKKESIVTCIICDPTFVKAGPEDSQIRVTLSSHSPNITSKNTFTGGNRREEKAPATSNGPFQTVLLSVGALVEKQDYRCKVIDTAGQAITVLRGGNTDITFGDGGKGEWTFKNACKVDKIICDPSFQKASS